MTMQAPETHSHQHYHGHGTPPHLHAHQHPEAPGVPPMSHVQVGHVHDHPQPRVVKQLEQLVKRAEGRGVIASLELLSAPVDLAMPIPIEQLKGDLARSGHRVLRIMALDPESNRLFFTDEQSNSLFAEFAAEGGAYHVTKVGFQHEVAKDYDPVDLEPDGEESTVVTTHQEAPGYKDDPGVIPSGTPGVKPGADFSDTDDMLRKPAPAGGDRRPVAPKASADINEPVADRHRNEIEEARNAVKKARPG